MDLKAMYHAMVESTYRGKVSEEELDRLHTEVDAQEEEVESCQ